MNMTSNVKLILSAVGAAALLASPALAKPQRHTPAPVQAETRAPASQPVVVPYAADAPVSPYKANNGLNHDFQMSPDK
jgi:hypothetical protein